jgi:DNA-binding MarR family transcriptional regulator
MKDKTIACLKLCSMPADERIAYEVMMWMRYSKKAVNAKLKELVERGYIQYGTSQSDAWLTEKGEKALREATNAGT